MAKKKMTIKKGAATKSDVNKTQEIKNVLAVTPDKQPKDISAELTAKGVDVTPAYVSTIKTKMKSNTESPEKKVTGKKKATKKKAAKKQTPKAAPATDITYDQLQTAKQMAQQLGGLEKAKEALAALSQLVG